MASHKVTWNIDVASLFGECRDVPQFFDFVLGFRQLADFADANDVCIVSYEDLVQHPQLELERVFRHLGVASCDIGEFDPTSGPHQPESSEIRRSFIPDLSIQRPLEAIARSCRLLTLRRSCEGWGETCSAASDMDASTTWQFAKLAAQLWTGLRLRIGWRCTFSPGELRGPKVTRRTGMSRSSKTRYSGNRLKHLTISLTQPKQTAPHLTHSLREAEAIRAALTNSAREAEADRTAVTNSLEVAEADRAALASALKEAEAGNTALANTLKEAEADRATLTNSLQEVGFERDSALAWRDAILASRSWRITAPLRKVRINLSRSRS